MIWYVLHLASGLIVSCETYKSAVAYVEQCGGVIVRGDSPVTDGLLTQCRKIWNA